MNLTVPRAGREKYVSMLRELHASRVFFALGSDCVFNGSGDEELRVLAENCSYFKDAGFEVGAWLWAFLVKSPMDFVRMEGVSGKRSEMTVCPTDESYRRALGGFISRIALCGVDLIMFDDDLRYGFQGCGFGCVCENHLRMIGSELGREVGREELCSALLSGGKSPLRDAFLSCNGRALETFCADMRRCVDVSDPSVRLGFCACITSWGIDGTTPDRLARILAGGTRPFYRLIGAPYWAALRVWGNRLGDVIELERIEAGRRKDVYTEIFSEGDTYPRPRFATPASYLECFDTALRASGTTDGILKYMFDYTANAGYETGYYEAAKRGAAFYPAIDELFAGKNALGVRVWDDPEKYRTYDIPDRLDGQDVIQESAFPAGARFLTANSIPSVHSGAGCGGIAFGEDARNLPASAFEKALVLDASAARILTQKGVDVGTVSFGAGFAPDREYYPDGNEYVPLPGVPRAYRLTLSPGARAVSFGKTDDGEDVPLSYTYENAAGQRFLVFAFEGELSDQGWFRTYRRALQTIDFFSSCSSTLPAVCPGHPELYILTMGDGRERAVGLWNLSADPVWEPTVTLDKAPDSVEGVKGDARCEGRTLTLSDIAPFDYALLKAVF
ncbi:MAG: hypothetical protein K6C36_01600 [Clostridia bacterium]|nr:hypothetical protein [Clostridia bacterium]